MAGRKPLIGRVVHYVSTGVAEAKLPSGHRLALITGVDSAGSVSLCVVNPNRFFFHPSVRQDEAGAPGTWHWPERPASGYPAKE
jgi:hypothetical protein